MKKTRRHKCGLPQLVVKSKIETTCYYQTFVLCKREELQNRKQRQLTNRSPNVKKFFT